MPRTRRPPSYRLQKSRGLAVVTINGRDHYLGPFGSPESHEKYARLISQWRVDGPELPPPLPAGTNGELTVNELILRYLDFTVTYYKKNGAPTGEHDNIRFAVRPLKSLYGRTPAAEFSAGELELVREAMIDLGWSRKSINRQVGRVKRMFRWATTKSLVSPGTYHGLLALEGLKWGRSRAHERAPVTTVDAVHVQKTCEFLGRYVGAMVQVQELAGMRPQDIRNLRTCDLDRSDDVWVYQPWTHKTEHHGHVRRIVIGPRAQEILKPFLKSDRSTEYVFSPKEAIADKRAEARRRRKTSPTPSQRARTPNPKRKRPPRDQYSQHAYTTVVRRAALRAGVPRWTPHQLRHNCGTRIRKKFGLEGAAVVLGHKHGTVTEVYAEADLERAKEIMREMG